MKDKCTITRKPETARAINKNGKTIAEADAQYDMLDMPGSLLGVTWRLPPGGAEWQVVMKDKGFAQDPTTKLVTVPASVFGTHCQQYAESGNVTCAIFPDDSQEIGELHIVCGPKASVAKFQAQINETGMAVDITAA
jgi:hypothetical protein